ncbi:conserved hypothetical protein [Ricinus communis]|uniref:Uncharacterized protein n=1 Tax=Ricinus communis TaxID=3988 RepID=B9T8U7_RICCO|nr:conserved hypothetical protein [Ricinus communis]
MVEKLLSDLRLTISQAIKVEAFTLETGHPFYPVFREFAFLCERLRRPRFSSEPVQIDAVVANSVAHRSLAAIVERPL